MIVEYKMYCIISKKRPIEFLMQNGDRTNSFDEAWLYNDFDDVQGEINELDNPEDWEIMTVTEV